MQAYHKTILSNGLRIITVPNPDAFTTTFLVLVQAGSKYETKDINGLSHFLEHMCFKGTTKRPHAIDIAGELDGLGAEYNAFTSQEYTGYFAKVEAHKIDQAFDIVSDLYLNPVFEAAEIEKEKGVIIEEINMYEDLPMRKINDYFMELMYGDQPAGWDVAGKKDIIRSLGKDDFVRYRGEHYLPPATIVIAAGAFDEAQIIQKIKETFGAMATGVKSGKAAVIESQTAPQVFLKTKKVDQTHLMLGVRAFPASDSRRFALEVLSDILGGGMSSSLFQKVREELGAAYYVKSSTDLFTDHGFLAVNTGIDQGKMPAVLQAILGEMSRLATELVSPHELQRAKSHIVGTMILGLEGSDAIATFYGGQEIAGEPLLTPHELVAKLEAVTAEEIQAVARDLFHDDRLNCAMIGPWENDAELRASLHFP